MACNPRSRERLIEQLKARKMAREYVAFVNGKPKHPNGTWRNWLELSSDQTRQRIVTQDQSKAAGVRAQEAITHYETVAQYNLENGAVVSQLQVRLETGRRHQIRIQSAAAGLPIIGDRTYNEAYRRANVESAPIQFPRQALHAQRLILEHPETGAQLSWTAQLPPDMRQLVAKLRSMAS